MDCHTCCGNGELDCPRCKHEETHGNEQADSVCMDCKGTSISICYRCNGNGYLEQQ